jgi:3-deoxy-D-manno-octulosonic-acid transferase
MSDPASSPGRTLSTAERGALLVYRIITTVMLPGIALFLLWRCIRYPGYRSHWTERFGIIGRAGHRWISLCAFPDAQPGHVLWIHAVSVGETRAATSLVAAWLDADPDHRLILTHGTPTGRAAGAELLRPWQESATGAVARVRQVYLPYDFSWAVRRFLQWARPDVAVLMETELWPALLAELRQRRIPVVLANARLSPRSARRMMALPSLARPALLGLRCIAAQSPSDAAAFERIMGPDQRSPIEITGTMKFDLAPSQHHQITAQAWRPHFAGRRIWLAASTREGEEVLILNAWRTAREQGRLASTDLLFLVPRHPQRFDRIAEEIARCGFPLSRRSSWPADGPTGEPAHSAVVLGDSMGEMFTYLYLADIVLMGGSLLPFGGQNPIEACATGRPVFFGPHMFNFSDVAAALHEAGAGIRVEDADDWIDQGLQLAGSPQEQHRRSVAALDVVSRHRGATQRMLQIIRAISEDR